MNVCFICSERYNPSTGQCTECGCINPIIFTEYTLPYISSNRFRYTRVNHFIGFIIRLQGGRTLTIPPHVFNDVKKCDIFRASPTYGNVRKALKITHNNDYYNHTVHIHASITNVTPITISHIQHKLVADFTEFQNQFDRTHTHRKNIFNYNLILHQLLRKHNICNTYIHIHQRTPRRRRQDEQCASIFHQLGWDYESIYARNEKE